MPIALPSAAHLNKDFSVKSEMTFYDQMGDSATACLAKLIEDEMNEILDYYGQASS